MAAEEGVSGDWDSISETCTALLKPLNHSASLETINRVLNDMGLLLSEVINILKFHSDSDNPSTNDAHSEHHTQSSNTESHIESERHRKSLACEPDAHHVRKPLPDDPQPNPP